MGGRQKLLASFRGRPMIDYAIEAAQAWQPVVIANADVAAFLSHRRNVRTILNDAPERGMAHSLLLANAAIPADAALIVLLADKPLVTTGLISQIVEKARDADVVFPVHEESGEPGHPVVFSPRARGKIAALPDGDTLKSLRDDPSLDRRTVATRDRGAFFDVDTIDELLR
jgi:CTP:molybdopterin cytidylyltransferase MocA